MRVQSGHAWSLKGQCRFCRMTRQIFIAEGEPDCQWQRIGATNRTNSDSHVIGCCRHHKASARNGQGRECKCVIQLLRFCCVHKSNSRFCGFVPTIIWRSENQRSQECLRGWTRNNTSTYEGALISHLLIHTSEQPKNCQDRFINKMRTSAGNITSANSFMHSVALQIRQHL
jgi:hypothetical protein